MIILGIDPALTTLGWGIIQTEGQKLKYLASGIIRTSSNEFMQFRLANIVSQIEKIILNYTPQLISMEETFVNVNPTSSLKLGYVRGALMALIGKYSINFLELKPNLIKKAIVGKGHAEKIQVLHMIKLLISDTPLITSFDEADALAIAYAGSIYSKIK